MTTDELRNRSSELKIEKQSMINDTYYWVQLAREAVRNLPNSRFEFEVPKAGKSDQMRTVARNKAEIVKNRILNRDIYASAFVSMVASVEDYLTKVMQYILITDNRRIKCTVQGINFASTIEIVDFIDNSQETLLDNIISKRVASVFYATPNKQKEYFTKALGIDIDKDIWQQWIEIKARRDLWVHNGGIVNQVYIEKTKGQGLNTIGNEALIDDTYFSSCVSITKRLIGLIDKEIRNTFKEDA